MEKKDIIKICSLLAILLILLVPRFYRLQKNKNKLRTQIQFQKQRIEQLQKRKYCFRKGNSIIN